MREDIKTRKELLEASLTITTGVKIKFTPRESKKLSFSFDGKNEKAVQKLKEYFGNLIKSFSYIYDPKCNLTCIFVDAK